MYYINFGELPDESVGILAHRMSDDEGVYFFTETKSGWYLGSMLSFSVSECQTLPTWQIFETLQTGKRVKLPQNSVSGSDL